MIKDIQWGGNGLGPVVLDSTGAISFWKANAKIPTQLTLPAANVLGFSLVQSPTSSTQSYIAVNVGASAQEYVVDSTAGTATLKQKYTPTSGTFTQVKYMQDYTQLIVATDASNVQAYNCSSGQYLQLVFLADSPVIKITNYLSNLLAVLTQKSTVYCFDSSLVSKTIGIYLF